MDLHLNLLGQHREQMFAIGQVGQFSIGRVGQFYSGANNRQPSLEGTNRIESGLATEQRRPPRRPITSPHNHDHPTLYRKQLPDTSACKLCTRTRSAVCAKDHCPIAQRR
jgi:hypothetical protein